MKPLIYITSLLIMAGNIYTKPDPRQFQQERPDREQIQPERPEKRQFPKHWGRPPEIQTRDMVKLPGKFGMGSSTLANWIRENLKEDASQEKPKPKPKPKPPVKPEPPADVKEKLDAYKTGQKSLQDGLKAEINKLGKKPSREAVRKTVEKYRAENKDLIEAQKEIGKDIQEWHKDNRPERPARPEPSEEVKEKILAVKEKEKEMQSIRRDFHETLKESKDLTKEAREDMIKEFKEKNADKHKALKEAQKELQKKIRETKQTGDRRK